MGRAKLVTRLADPAFKLIAVATAVGVLVVAQLGLVIGGGVAANRQANEALNDSFAYLADVSEERVAAYADAAKQVVDDTVEFVEREQPTPSLLTGSLFSAVTSRAQVEAVSVTFPSGNYSLLRRSLAYAGGYSSYVITGMELGEPTRRTIDFDTQMRLVENSSSSVAFEAREVGCYERATRAAGPVWSGVEVSPITGLVQVWVCEAARNGDGDVTAVVSAAVALDDLGTALNLLPAGSDGQVFLLTGDRLALTAPPELSGLVASQVAKTGRPLRAIDLGVAASAMAASPDLFDVFGTDGDFITLERGLGTEGLDWVLHVRATETGVNAGFASLQRVLSFLVGGMVALTAGLGYLLWSMRGPLLAMRAVAERDPLTGLYNRRHLEARAAKLAAAAHRAGRRLAVVMMDLDNFKAINDDLGHQAGDKALSDISSVLVNEIRAADVAVRWGGDEFLVVLSMAIEDDAVAAVERIRERVEHTLLTRFAGRTELGVTAGFAVSTEAVADINALITAADAALVDGKWTQKGATYQADVAAAHER